MWSFRFLWPCNQSNVYYQTSISTCIGHHHAHRQENKAVYYCIWCFALVVWSCHKQCAVWTVTFTQCTLLTTQLHTTTASLSQHNQCRTPYAVVHSLVLLTMGTMMPETCWDRSLIINIWLVASCWFLSLHTTWCGVFLSINLLHMKPWACMDVCP